MAFRSREEIRAAIAFSDPLETFRAWKRLIIPEDRLAAARERSPEAVREIEELVAQAEDCSNADEQRALLLRAAKALIDLLTPKH